MAGVVIIAFKRPKLLSQILEQLDKRVTRIYILVDYDPLKSDENLQCKQIVIEAMRKDNRVSGHFSKDNLGPGRAVPHAISWAFETEETLIVLEDDCIPSAKAIEYFEHIFVTRPDAEIICGSSPFDFRGKTSKMENLTTSKYALISGWAIRRLAWHKLEIENINKYSYIDVLKLGLRNPKNFISLSFFYSSMIRVRANLVEAWDSNFCFSMLANDMFSIIPNVTLISNLGLDSVASNTKATENSHSNVYQAASSKHVAQCLDLTKHAKHVTNREIEKSIYKMKIRHLFSPLKSFILSR